MGKTRKRKIQMKLRKHGQNQDEKKEKKEKLIIDEERNNLHRFGSKYIKKDDKQWGGGRDFFSDGNN